MSEQDRQSSQRPRKRRAAVPPRDLHERDIQILIAIWKYEGLLTVGQIQQIVGIRSTQAYDHLAKLYDKGCICRVDETNRDRALYRGVVWLDTMGAKVVAAAFGKDDLSDFPYLREPGWQKIPHNLRLNDLRLRMEAEVAAIPGAALREWLSEYELRQSPDLVVYRERMTRGKERTLVERRKEVVPDGYCYLTTPAEGGLRDHYRFLLEVDMATENKRGQFGRDKVLPLTAYLESEVYRERFGGSGRVLVVTTTPARLANIRAQTVEYGGKSYFLFTTFAQIEQAANVWTAPIWLLPSGDQPLALLST